MRSASACLAAVGLLASIASSTGCSSSSAAPGGNAGQGGAGGASATFPVDQPRGAVLWLDAGKGVIGTTSVTTWVDQSGRGNDASASGTGPTLKASAIHSLLALSFTSQQMPIASSGTLGMFTDEFTIEVVAKVTSPGSELFTLSHGQTSARMSIAGTGLPTAQLTERTTFRIASGTTSGADGQPRIYAARRIGSGPKAMLELRVNGTVVTTTSGVGTIDLGTDSGGTVGGPDTVADIAEVVVIAGTISGADLAAVESYLKTKYGL